MHHLRSWQRTALACAIAVPIAAAAQPHAEDPRTAASEGSASHYQSSFAGYAADRDVSSVPWRQANDNVRFAAEGGDADKGHAAPDTAITLKRKE